ncbi:TIR domain-containing adapter molecule 1 [Dasypus novemcinctus]|uniref:TIR domain-containing adapter molecule 1 n=1 Tax=Dasypus novemcinctus TaxID=9361 RepID=UPI00265FB3DB|nr:TIR domain-containing adapter molecule 1 [Dasypus novemcinctus]XP_058138023.1 TIR domain-containing adapter molecule 1 [Dasypus novemcinctus]
MPMAGPGPSLSGAFDVLGRAGQDKLLYLKHKLKTRRCPGAHLLHAMVLLRLGQETEARISLEALRADEVARLVARRWAGVNRAESPGEPPYLAWTVAHLYHLLAEEKLCPASLREEAFGVALRVLASRDDPRLGELQAEARDRCGWDMAGNPGGFQPLRSELGCLPPSSASPSATRSLPQPIEGLSGWSQGCPLRSTDTPSSLASDLEISQSPTMRFISQHRAPPGPSKLCDEPLVSPVPEEMSWPGSLQTAGAPAAGLPTVAPDPSPEGLLGPSAVPETSSHRPVDCTEVSEAPNSLPSPAPEPPENPRPANARTPLPLSVEDTTSQEAMLCPPTPSAPKTSPVSPPLPPPCSPAPFSSPCPPPPELEAWEQKFYNFVILHARVDEHVALRVRERLEALGVPDGATFCEDFQVPGRGELRCLQDAIDHSAFTVLLLTSNFDCRLSLHQVSQALMGSLTRHGWHDSVIPFLPLETSRAQLGPDTAGLLAGLVMLDEHSPIFARRVGNTFRARTLRARRATWEREQEARAMREQSQRLEGERQRAAALSSAYSAYCRSYLAWQGQMEALQAAFGAQMSFGTQVPSGVPGPGGGQGPPGPQPPFPAWPGCPQPPLRPWGPPPPACPPATPGPPPGPGVQPLIIHHAQMVQLGLYNHMWGQRGAQAPEDKPGGAE